MDGVIADFNTGWISRYNRDFGADVAFDAVTSWNAIPSLTHFRHMGEFWKWAQDHDGRSLFHHLEPYPGAIESLERLSELHDIVIITTKPDWAVPDTFSWLSRHRIPTREVHIREEKWTVVCDAYLDDAPHILWSLVEHRPESLVCRFVRPWNEEVPGSTPTHNWDEFEDIIRSFSKPTGSTWSQPR